MLSCQRSVMVRRCERSMPHLALHVKQATLHYQQHCRYETLAAVITKLLFINIYSQFRRDRLLN